MENGPLLLRLGDRRPKIDPAAFVAPGAVVVGDVTIGARAGIWYATVVRGDTAPITVGAETNIQDGSVLHADPGAPLVVGARVTVGHRVVLHGAVVADDVLIGMGSVVMNHARIGAGSVVGAGALIVEGTEVPPGSLVLGAPGRVVRSLTAEERAGITEAAGRYVRRAAEHRAALVTHLQF
ncbi:gamma carbonic anhydrase family protein [Virgisporangium aliadipatigenens]|uniref:Gamma carbonic anhydrase family protein n=1 Tax=Virgisporangium aliadipatigenens TaxID=741659 RepID=A0A8J3YL98_9ACTN|nr:gamma carbonic anhydrase family protein [Virgisporangium aliadipatigenens]GIJ46040.1 gamma carbonic anhydrase family protein [Virgisporangium aliadipatigenens]